MKSFEINGSKFHDLGGFYDEVERTLCPQFKGFGRNLNAFDDVLSGGFLTYEYGERIRITWVNSAKSKKDLGVRSSIKALEEFRRSQQPFISRNQKYKYYLKKLFSLLVTRHPTLYDDAVRIIRNHKHIDFVES